MARLVQALFAVCGLGLVLISCSEKKISVIDYRAITDIRYGDHVQPLLDNSCGSCHTGPSAAAGLRLDSWGNLIAGSDHGEDIIAYDSENSRLIEMNRKLLGGPHPSEYQADTLDLDQVEFLARWIDAGAFNESGEIPYADSRNRLYVPSQNAALVSVIDVDARLVIRNVKLTDFGYSPNAKPHHIAVEPDGSAWYVSLIDENKVVKFNQNNEFVAEATIAIPALLALNPNSNNLYVSRFMIGGNIPNSIGVIDRSSMTPGDEINVFFDIPHCMAVAPSGNRIFTASLSQNQAVIINADSNEVDQFIALGNAKGPLQIAVSPDGQTLFISAQLANQMLVVDLQTHSLLGEVAVGQNPWHPVYSPDGSRVYVGNFGSNSVSVIDAAALTVVSTLTGAGLAQPHGIAITGDGTTLFVSNRNVSGDYQPRHDFGDNRNVGTVVVINTLTQAIEKTLEVEAFASGISIWQQ